MKEIVADTALVARCGLYCGACRSYLKGKCPGCAANAQATWCKVRSCCAEHGRATCAECTESPEPRDCRKFHNPFSRLIGFVLRSDRRAGILRIREVGLPAFAAQMAASRRQALPRR